MVRTLILLVAGLWTSLLFAATPNSISFNQVDFYQNGTVAVARSGHGEFTVSYSQDPAGITFLNVVQTNTGSNAWIVRNHPLLSTAETGTASFNSTSYYNLGVSDGTNLVGSEVDYFYSITSLPMTAAPVAGPSGTAMMGSSQSLVNNGSTNGPNTVNKPPDYPFLQGIQGFNTATGFFHKGMGNVIQTASGCAPGAAANSMQWLAGDNAYMLNQTPAQTYTEMVTDMKTVTGRGPGTGTQDVNVVSGLMKYVKDHNLPVEVHYAGGRTGGLPSDKNYVDPGGNGTATHSGDVSWSFLEQEMQKGQNVIAQSDTHTVVVEGLVSSGDLHFIVYRDDNLQDGSTDPGMRHWASQFSDKANDGTAQNPPKINFGNGVESLHTVIAESPKPQISFLQTFPMSGHWATQFGNPMNPCNHPLFLGGMLSFDIVVQPDGTVKVSTINPLLFNAAGMCNFNTMVCKAHGDGIAAGFPTVGDFTFAFQPPLNNLIPLINGSYAIGGDGSLPGACPITWPLIGLNIAPLTTFPGTSPAIAGDPVSAATGELIERPDADLSLGGPLPLVFQRYYGSLLSLNGINGALGNNWRHNFEVFASVSGAAASVTTFHGEVIRFTLSGSTWHTITTYRLGYQFATVSGGYQFLDPADNLTYSFGTDGKLIRINDRNGNALTVTPGASGPTQVADGLGRTLTFTYTSDGKLAKVQDQTNRSVSFSYNGPSLTSMADANGKTTTFANTSAGSLNSLLSRTTLPAGNTRYSQGFDSNGRVTSQADGRGNTTTLLYSDVTLGTTTVRDARGNTTIQEHPNLTEFMGSIDANGEFTFTSYDGAGRPISVVDRNGNKSTATYHSPSGYLATFTDADGNTTSFSYNASARNSFTYYDMARITYADGTSASFTYDGSGNPIQKTDAAGSVIAYTYNPRGQALTVTNGAGGVTTYVYNNDGTIASLKSPAGDLASYSYDALKRPSQIKFADGSTRSIAYDPLDGVTKVTDERSKNTTLSYTDNSAIASIADSLGDTTALAYDAAANLASVKAPAGTTAIDYNEVSLPRSVKSPTGETTSFAYDKLNRLASINDGSGQLASFVYDREHGLTSATDGANRTFLFSPDRLGRPRSITTPLGETWQRSFDKLGRITSTQDPLGQVTSLSYDADGRISGITLPGSVQALFGRDRLGNITSITDPSGGAWTRSYDRTGRLTSRTDPLGRSISFGYDQRNRISSATTPQGNAQFTHDAAGNLTRRLFDDGTEINYTYDDAGRMTGGTGLSLAWDAGGWIVNSNGLAITRDASERISAVTYSAGAVTYSYNNRGQLAQITDWTGAVTSFTYDASLRISGITRANGVVTQFSYDGDGNLAGIVESGGGNTVSSIGLQRDAAGRITSTNRMLPQAAAPAPGFLGLAYDAGHQISGATYDGLGRLTSDGIRSYTWDLGSRLTSYSGADGAASFTYDALGSRISRTSSGITESYAVNYGLALPSVAVVQSGGADERYYIYLPSGMLLASIEAADNSHHYFHFDESGNTLFLTDDGGNVTDSYGITPYGESVTQAGSTANPFTWQGAFGVMQEPSTSLYYLRARYYDSGPARFLSPDPVESHAPNAINPYQYALGNPAGVADPMGLSPGLITDPTTFFPFVTNMYQNALLPTSPAVPNLFVGDDRPRKVVFRDGLLYDARVQEAPPIDLLPWLEKLFVSTTYSGLASASPGLSINNNFLGTPAFSSPLIPTAPFILPPVDIPATPFGSPTLFGGSSPLIVPPIVIQPSTPFGASLPFGNTLQILPLFPPISVFPQCTEPSFLDMPFREDFIGIVPPSQLCPSQILTRQQIATFVVRAFFQ